MMGKIKGKKADREKNLRNLEFNLIENYLSTI